MALLISVSAHAKVIDLTSPAQVKQELAKKGPMVVLYYTSWCGACKAYKPSFEKASKKFTDVRFYKMDLDKIGLKEHKGKTPYIPMLFFGKDEDSLRNRPCIDQDGERDNLKAFFKRCQSEN
jgi:thiol-disulfide isomerase/thioredoxin